MTIEKHEIDIVSLVYQGVGEYSNLYEEKNMEFKVNTNEDEIFVDLDGKLMSRVFENIIVNALKYSLNNTRVYIDINSKINLVEVCLKIYLIMKWILILKIYLRDLQGLINQEIHL